MPPSNLVRLFVLLNRGTRRRLVAANVGLVLGVTLVLLFVSAGLGLRDALLRDVLGALPLTQLEVQPRSMQMGMLQLGRGESSGGRPLDESTVATLEELPEVVAVHPIVYAHFPVSVRGDLLGSSYGTDAPVQGVSPRWVAHEVDPDYTFDDDPSRPIPILVSRKVLQAYNVGFARANGLPRLTEGAIVGQELEIDLGASSLGGASAGREVRPAVIVGFSDRVAPLAVGIPLGTVMRYAERFGEPVDAYDAVVIEAHAPGDLPAIERVVASLGLELAPDAYLARQVGRSVTLVVAILSAVGMAVVALALLNAANTLLLVLRERRFELAVVRAVGVGETLLSSILVAEAALSGLLAAGVSVLLSVVVLEGGSRLLAGTLVPLLGSAPSFALPGWLVAVVLVLTPSAAAVAALIPARRAVGVAIASALRR